MVYVVARFAAEATEATEPTGLAKLGLNPLDLLLQLLTFLILFIILKKYAFGPIMKLLEERRKTIDDGIRLGREMEAEKAKLDERVAAELHKAREEADSLLADAHKQAGEVVKAAEETAEQKADGIIADAHSRIERDVKAARDGLASEMSGLVADATEVIIDEKLDASKDARLIEKALQGARQ